jgi:hypothetical protein
MKKIAATLIAGLFATAAFAQTAPAPTTASASPSAMPAAGQEKQDAGSDAKDSPVAHKSTATKHAKKHASSKAKAKMPAEGQDGAAASTATGSTDAGSAAATTK